MSASGINVRIYFATEFAIQVGMWLTLCTIVISSTLLTITESIKLPSYITPCSKKDPNINECAIRSGQLAIPGILKGDKTYKIPNLHPLKIDRLTFEPSQNLRVNLKNVNIYGFESGELKDTNIDLEKRHVTFLVYLPRTVLIGDYTINGRILILPIQGEGQINITFIDGTYKYEFEYDLKDRKGVQYMEVKNNKLHYETKRAYYYLENLFNGDKILGEEMNKFMNENWKDVNNDIGPALSDTINQIITTILTALLRKVSYDEFFID